MFDLRRFLRLAAAQWAEYRKTYAWFLGIGIIVHFVLVLALLSGDGFRMLNTDGQGAIYFAGLYLTAPIFAARYFQAMSRPESALVALMRPASAFEKWLLALIVVAVAYPVAYTLAYYVCNVPASWLAATAASEELARQAGAAGTYPVDSLQPARFRLFHVWNELEGALDWTPVLLSLTAVQAFGVLGSLYFRSMPFIKTILAGFVLLLLSILVSAVLQGRPETFFGFWRDNAVIGGWQAVYVPLVWFGVPALLWLGCLFALRERELA
ncbi:hypothetical protein [Arenimonas sp. MALMAid1274]|uniref:hypothetical protein n=1 Tax=Arenimonas sp. MALMAid1274 TaxID=3411630 RepID=UPI003B9F94AF